MVCADAVAGCAACCGRGCFGRCCSGPLFFEADVPLCVQLPTELKVACDSYRTGTANSLYIGDDTQIAYETVCGKKDLFDGESPWTDRLLCQEFGSFPPLTDQITGVCDPNNRYQNFLQCWGSGGLLTRLVENRRFVSYAGQSFGALQDLVSEQKGCAGFMGIPPFSPVSPLILMAGLPTRRLPTR